MNFTTKSIKQLARYKDGTGRTSLDTDERMNFTTKFINLLAKRMNVTGIIINRMPKRMNAMSMIRNRMPKRMNATGMLMNQTPKTLEFPGHNPQTRNPTTKHHQNLSTTQYIKEKERLLGEKMKSDGC